MRARKAETDGLNHEEGIGPGTVEQQFQDLSEDFAAQRPSHQPQGTEGARAADQGPQDGPARQDHKHGGPELRDPVHGNSQRAAGPPVNCVADGEIEPGLLSARNPNSQGGERRRGKQGGGKEGNGHSLGLLHAISTVNGGAPPAAGAARRMVGMIASVNPASGETLRTFEALNNAQIEDRLARAGAAYRKYRQTAVADRQRWLLAAAQILETERDRLGRMMTLEMGKPIGAARAEAAKCATACRYYAEHGERLLADEPVDAEPGRAFLRYQPIGPVLAVMPWNFPFWQVFRFAAPVLMAGNVGLLKHASNVPQCALEIEEILRRAGFPADAFQTLLIGSGQVAQVLDDPRVKAASLTGSEPAGAKVASQAGREIKKTLLELGGSDPFIVMPSADFDRAVRTAVEARTINNGQSCIAAKRFIVHCDISDRFEREFVGRMNALRVGDPLDESTQVGPLATPDILEGLDEQVRRTVEMGGRLLSGGRRIEGRGNFYMPTVLADVPEDSPAWREELFGPVAVLARAEDATEAIARANNTDFGLGASAWTTDAAEQARFVEELEAGMVFVNGMVASDARLPFGGVKRSGYGRELGEYGIREFQNVKTVRIA